MWLEGEQRGAELDGNLNCWLEGIGFALERVSQGCSATKFEYKQKISRFRVLIPKALALQENRECCH